MKPSSDMAITGLMPSNMGKSSVIQAQNMLLLPPLKATFTARPSASPSSIGTRVSGLGLMPNDQQLEGEAMEWGTKQYKHGDSRVKTKFLMIPKCINGQCKWLERASWIEKCWVGFESNAWVAEAWRD